MRLGETFVARLALGLALVMGPGLQTQQWPEIAIDSFPAVSREPIGRALADARAHTDDPRRVGALGMMLHAWDQFETASAVYARARALERRYDWFYLAGVVETRLAHHAAAAALLREAVALSPTVPARLALADALFESGDVDASEPLYRALVAEPAAEPHARYGVGRVLAARGAHEAALRELDAAISLFPEFGAAWYAKGFALRSLRRVAEARVALGRAQELVARWPAVADPLLASVSALRDDPAAHVRRGRALEARGDVAGAIREHEAALAADPAMAQAHVNLISLYGRQGAWQPAEAHYREAVRLGSAVPEAHYNYGVLLVMQQRDAEATAAFRLALAGNPENAGAWNNLGHLAERGGQPEAALDAYRRAVERAPADSMIRFNLARMLIATRHYTEAIPQLEMLSAVDGPERPRYVFGLATAWVHAGDLGKGRQYAAEARALAAAKGQLDLVAAIDRQLAGLPQ
jgi:tetratricopeptide (TPR) repeat protein